MRERKGLMSHHQMDVKFFLEDLFQCKVDLVLEKTLKPRLRPYILAEVEYAQGL